MTTETAPGAWEALMAAAQAGDGRAYDRLLRQLLPMLRGIARRRIANPADAEDAVQETLVTLHRLRHAYDPARPLRPWLAALCERRCVDHLRRAGRRPAEIPWSEEAAVLLPRAADAAFAHLEAIELHAAVARLPAAQRAAVQLGTLGQLPLAEVGARTGRSRTAIKVATHRAVRRLRRQFGLAIA
jgi:RNA polymerase sigma-70 factor (ECF subfamily)